MVQYLLSSVGDNPIAVQVTTRASSSSATNTHAVSENCILYHSQVNVLRTCRIASEQSVQGGQPKPTRTQPSGYSQTYISNRAYSVGLTENDWKHAIWFQARDRLQPAICCQSMRRAEHRAKRLSMASRMRERRSMVIPTHCRTVSTSMPRISNLVWFQKVFCGASWRPRAEHAKASACRGWPGFPAAGTAPKKSSR